MKPQPLIAVRDVEASSAWYQHVMGMETVFSEGSAERRAVILRFPGGEGDANGIQREVARVDIAMGGVLMLDIPKRPRVLALNGDALDGRW